jgi:hypothetical protein
VVVAVLLVVVVVVVEVVVVVVEVMEVEVVCVWRGGGGHRLTPTVRQLPTKQPGA